MIPDHEVIALQRAWETLGAEIAGLDPEERKHFRDLLGEGINRVHAAILQYKVAKLAEGLRHTDPN